MEKSDSSKYPLHDAIRSKDVSLCRQLIAQGIDINAQDGSKRSPLHLAAWMESEELVKLLLDLRAKTDAKAMDGFTALHFAAQKGNNVEVLKLLVKADKSLLHARITKGNKTALHVAAPKGNLEYIRCLVELGADVSAKASNQKTPWDLCKNEEVFKYLRSAARGKHASKGAAENNNLSVDGSEICPEKATATGITMLQEEHEGRKRAASCELKDSSHTDPAAVELSTTPQDSELWKRIKVE